MLPQRIADWVDRGIAMRIYYMCMYYARDRALEVGIPIPTGLPLVSLRHSAATIIVFLPLPIILAKEQECGMPYIVYCREPEKPHNGNRAHKVCRGWSLSTIPSFGALGLTGGGRIASAYTT
jgi:hypothetical protein